MGRRGPSAQYAYGITVELNKDYQKELKTLSDGLEDLEKKIKNTQKSFSSGIQSSGNKGFEQVQRQTAEIVESVDRLLQLEKELGGVNAPKIFDGLKQNRDDIAKLSGDIKDIRNNFAALSDTVKSLPSDLFSRLSDLFVYDEKGATGKLKNTAEAIKGIINDISKSTDKEKLGSLMNQLTQMVSEFQIGLTQATNKGWDVSSRALAKTLTELKGMLPQLSTAGDGFDSLAQKIVGFYNIIGQQYRSSHPTGKSFFADIAIDASNAQSEIGKATSKTVASLNAIIQVVDKLKNSDMGLSGKSKELEAFLAKLQNPEITIKVNKNNVISEFDALADKVDKIAGDVFNLTPEFFKTLSIDQLKELGDALQNMVAIGSKYKKEFASLGSEEFGNSADMLRGYSSDLNNVMTELENRLNTTKESVQQLSNQLQSMLEKAGLKEIKLELGVPAEEEIETYVAKINAFIDKLINSTMRIKKIPLSIAFDSNKSTDANGNEVDPAATLKQQLESLKDSIHTARTNIESDARELKRQLVDMLKFNKQDVSNINTAFETLFNENPIQLYVDEEFLINQIETILKSRTFNISANISGTTYSGGSVPTSSNAPASGAAAAETQKDAANTQTSAASDQTKAASENANAAEDQKEAAKEQKAAAEANNSSAKFMSKSASQLTAFVKSFGKIYAKALSAQQALNNKIANGETVNERSLRMANGKVNKLTPMANYLQDIFGKDTDLAKITEEYVTNILTGLLQKNATTGGFKGELLEVTLSSLLKGWKGSYKDQTALLAPLLGSNGTLNSLFKAMGLSAISESEKVNRDYNAPEMLKFYQKFAKLADVLNMLKLGKGDTKQLLSELSNILKDIQATTVSEEYKTNIDKLGESINTLYSNINQYDKQVIATQDLAQGNESPYTTLLNMFKQFYGTASAETQNFLNAAIGANPSDVNINGNMLSKAKDAMLRISGDDASSKIANDIIRWLDRMVAKDNVMVARQTLLDQLGKGAKDAGLKIATSKNMLRKAGNGTSKNSQLQASAAGIAHAILKSLDADIYIDGNDTPITLTGKAITPKIESLLSISKGAKLGAKTQFYSKDNQRPAPLDLSQIKVSDEYSIDWEERLATAEENVQKSTEQLAAAKQARDTRLSELTKNEETLNQQIRAARESVNAAQETLNNIQPSSYTASPEIESLKSDYKKQKEIYDLMVKYQNKTPSNTTLKFEGKNLSNDYVQLLEAKKQAESRLKIATSTANQYKQYEKSPDTLNKVILSEQKKQEVIEKEIADIESKISTVKESGNKTLLSKYQIELTDKQNALEQSKSRLANYVKIQNGEKVSSEFEIKAKEQEAALQTINEQIQQSIIGQKQKIDDALFKQLQLTIEQYKQRQQELSGLDKNLKKETPGTAGYDKIAAQIQTAKESLNGLFDSITNISNDLGLNDVDLKDLFTGMDKQSFYNSKNARDSLKQQIDALKQFKNSENFGLSNLEIFPKELQTLLQQRAELFNEKSNYDNAKTELKDYKQRLKEAALKGSTEIQSILQRRVDALQGYIDNARSKKEINTDISNLNAVIKNYISSIMQQYGTYITKSKSPLQKYDIGDSVVGKYTSVIESQRSSLIPLTEQKKAIDLEKESLDNQVKAAESQLKAAERVKQVAQLQIEYNKKKDEELELVREINKLEEAGTSPAILSEKTQALRVVNAEVTDLYNKLKEINGINSSNIFDDSLSPEQKKLTALEKIQELQKIIIQNNEKIAQLDTYTKDVKKAQNLAFNKEQGSFTTLYGNRSTTADSLKKMFVAHYTSTDEYQEYKTSLYAKAQEKTNELSNALTKRISEVVDSVYQNALSTFIQSKYGEDGAYLHSRAWDIGQATIEQEIREAIEARLIAINNEESIAIEEIIKNDSLSTDEIMSEISRVSKTYDQKRASLTNGEEIKNIISQKASQFFNAYYDNLNQLLIEKFGERFTDNKLKDELKSILSGMILTTGKGKDQVETAFGKRISNVLNQAEEVEKTIIPKMYEAINKKLAERIVTYLGTISEDATRIKGEVATDKVFTDGKGFRVNLAKLYRDKNAYFFGIKESLERESKDAELWIEKYKAYGGVSKEEIARIAEARDRAYLKLYGGSSSDIQNLDILIDNVDYTPIVETIKNGAKKTIKKTSEIAQQAIEQGIANAGATDTTTAQTPQLKNIAEMSKKELEKEMAAAIQTLTERAQDAAHVLSGKNGDSVKQIAEITNSSIIESATIAAENLNDLLISNPNKVLEIAKSDPERVKKELFGYLEELVLQMEETPKSFLEMWLSGRSINSTDFAKIISYYYNLPAEFFTRNSDKNITIGVKDMQVARRLGMFDISNIPSLGSSLGNVLQTIQILQEIVDTVYPNNFDKFDVAKIDQGQLQTYLQTLLRDYIGEYLEGLRQIQGSSLEENKGYTEEMIARGKQHQAEALSSISKLFGGISEADIIKALNVPSITTEELYNKLYLYNDNDFSKNLIDTVQQNIMSVYKIPSFNTDQTTQSLIEDTIQNGSRQIVKKTSEITQQAIEQGVASASTTDTTTAQDVANIIANQNGSSSTAKSKNIYGSQYNGALNPILGDDIRTASQFQNLIVALMDAINNGINIGRQNVEYGFTEKNGKKVEFAIGDIEEVIFNSIYDDIDAMTHSHAYRKGLNNFVLSLGDIDQLSDIASEGKLKKYNMIYGREMMSIDLGKDSYGTALNIAEKYPIINDVITAMFSTANGEDIAAQNSDEMARIFNGCLQRMVQEAGGSLSIKDIPTGADIRNKYSITDEEYSKFNAVISQLTPYYNKVSNGTISVSTQEYVNVIRDVLSQAFGKDFISSLVNREYDRARGGITSEYSALSGAAYDPISDLFAKFLSRSKGAINYHDVYSQMSDEQIMERLQQLRAAIGETIDSTENKVKQTLTNSQMNMLNPDSTSAWAKRSIKDAGKVFNWDSNNYANIDKVLGKDNATIAQYQTELQTLKEIANDIRAKGANGTVITDADLQRLDDAVAKVKALQTELAKSAKIQSAYQTLEKEGRIVSGDSKISDNMLFTDRQAVMEAYAKQYAASKNSQYNFSQYDFVNDKVSFDMIDADGKITSVVMAWGEAFNSAYVQAEKLQGSCDNVTTSIHKINQAIVDGQKEGFFDKNSKEMQAYQSAMDAYGKAQETVRNSTANNLDENINKLKAAQEELVKLGSGILGKSKDAYGYNSATKVLNREGTVQQSLAAYQDQSVNVNNLKIVKDYYAALDALKRKKDELAQSGKLLSNENGEQAALKVLADRATEAEKALLKAHEAQLKINNDKITGERANFFENVNPQDINAVKNAMMSYVNSIQGASFKNFNAETRTMTYEVKHGKNEVQEMTMVMGDLGNAVEVIPGKIKPVETGFQSFLGGLKKKFKEVATYFASFGSIYRVWGTLKQGVQYVKEIDSALTELKKVTDETEATYARFLQTAAKAGSEIGTTISEFVNATADFARLGYSISEATDLAKAASVYKNVGDGITDVSQATESIISTMKAFGIAAENAMGLVDRFNEVGKYIAQTA